MNRVNVQVGGWFPLWREAFVNDAFTATTDFEWRLLTWLWGAAWRGGDSAGTVELSQAEIARQLGRRRDTVRDALRRLVDLDLIEMDTERGRRATISIRDFHRWRGLSADEPARSAGKLETQPAREACNSDGPTCTVGGQVVARSAGRSCTVGVQDLHGRRATPKGSRDRRQETVETGDPATASSTSSQSANEAPSKLEPPESSPPVGFKPELADAFALSELQAELRDAVIADLGLHDRRTAVTPGMTRPIMAALREWTREQLEHALRIAAAEARAAGSVQHFNGEANWQDWRIRKAQGASVEAVAKPQTKPDDMAGRRILR